MLSKFQSKKDIITKNKIKYAFQNIEKTLDSKFEPNMIPATKYLELNYSLIKRGWIPVQPKHPRESDK